jgi:hypothetical protein
MPVSNTLITLKLSLQWFRDHIQAMSILLLLGSIFVVHTLNSDTAVEITEATVLFSMNMTNKHSATDSHLVVRLQDGRTTNIYLPPTWVPPARGKTIRVKRITRLFFGERFVLLKE